MLFEKAKEIVQFKFPNFDFEIYEIQILRSDDGQQIAVFKVEVVFISLGMPAEFYCEQFTVDLCTQKIRFDFGFEANQIFIPTALQRKKITLLKQKLNLPRVGFTAYIYEKEDCLEVLLKSSTAFARYWLHKETGEELQAPIEGSYCIDPVKGWAID